MTSSEIDQFNAGRDLRKLMYDWFEGPEAKEGLAANEVLMRRCFALSQVRVRIQIPAGLVIRRNPIR